MRKCSRSNASHSRLQLIENRRTNVKTAIVAMLLATAIASPSNAQNVPASSNLDAHQDGPRTEVIRVPVNERALDHYMRQGKVFIPGLPFNARAYDYQMRRGR